MIFFQYKEKPVLWSSKKVKGCGVRWREREFLIKLGTPPHDSNPRRPLGEISLHFSSEIPLPLDLKSSTYSLDPFKRMCDLSLPGQFDHARLSLHFFKKLLLFLNGQ